MTAGSHDRLQRFAMQQLLLTSYIDLVTRISACQIMHGDVRHYAQRVEQYFIDMGIVWGTADG
jgi:hypothetical protein